jgi:hypothetical protein
MGNPEATMPGEALPPRESMNLIMQIRSEIDDE